MNKRNNPTKNEGPIDSTPIQLSRSQMDVLAAIAEGQSVFFSGAAGTGKPTVAPLQISHQQFYS